jgi:hypothetical protein
MTDEFQVKVNLPSGKIISLSELKNRENQVILKYCENSDAEGLNNYFNNTIFKHNKSLDIIDKFYTLLALRMIFIDPDIIFIDKAGNEIKYSIANILNKVELLDIDYNKRIIVNDNITIDLSLPNLLYFININDIYISTIKNIKLQSEQIIFCDLASDIQEEILKELPNSLFRHINKHITHISQQLQTLIIIEENVGLNISEYSTDIISNQLMGFIMSLFSTGLKNFFEVMYTFTTKLHIDGATFLNLTPLDSRVLLNIYNKDIDEQNKALKKQSVE